jgi:hypothetical protein
MVVLDVHTIAFAYMHHFKQLVENYKIDQNWPFGLTHIPGVIGMMIKLA